MNAQHIMKTVRRALQEDVGRRDVTTELLVDATSRATGYFLAKAACVLAGMPVAEAVFRTLEPEVQFRAEAHDGAQLDPGRRFAYVEGSTRTLLAGERVALNFLQRLSGIATLTRRAVDQTQGTRTKILDTRKTMPLLRAFDKYAVRVGGGQNHRFALDDGILIKDNHVAVAGGIAPALRAARAGAPHLLRVEIEVKTPAELEEALAENAEVILLDNMTPEQIRAAVQRVGGRARLEVSGGVTPETVRAYAETGVDFISLGALTHSVKAIDISFEIEPAA